MVEIARDMLLHVHLFGWRELPLKRQESGRNGALTGGAEWPDCEP
jgi:hypothetical protein